MVSEVCRAKNPTTCPYHGAVLQMYAAQAAGDFNSYFELRTQVEEMKKKNWDETTFHAAINTSPVIKGLSDMMNPPVDTSTVIPNLEEIMGSKNVPTTDDPRVQAGEVFDTIQVIDPDYPDQPQVFHRSREVGYPSEPQHIRIQADRELNDKDVEKIASLLGYSYRKTVAGESLAFPERDTPYSFIVFADTTKGDPSKLYDLEQSFETVLEEGSYLRKKNTRYGAAGTRAIDGYGANPPKVEFYYDDYILPE